ncbi:hypothetical protein [Thalassospira sp.]|uniref:hypothetical protein n=1 Tax=Thalassospira sp. TaxID=1912094 RepID=UPI001B215900|nr:hypothetical protein [Thalassospira sp.]MBO6806614.1 hypothetical protein [Thalassospira sp.]MBO6838865.1 hypothetical protein [Thalassospira sp.]
MTEFWAQNASAVFGLLGALGGSLIVSVTNYVSKTRDIKLQSWRGLLDRKISAHDQVLKVASEMHVMAGNGEMDQEGQIIRFPVVIQNREYFEEWFTSVTTRLLSNTDWLSLKAKREVFYLQDYLIHLHKYLNERDISPSSGVAEIYQEVGKEIREDFVTISQNLRQSAMDYFEYDINRMTFDNLKGHHKLQRKDTEERLLSSKLFSLIN